MKRNFYCMFRLTDNKIKSFMFNEILAGIQENGGEVLSTQIPGPYANTWLIFLVLYEDNGFYSEINSFLKDYENITKNTIWHNQD